MGIKLWKDVLFKESWQNGERPGKRKRNAFNGRDAVSRTNSVYVMWNQNPKWAKGYRLFIGRRGKCQFLWCHQCHSHKMGEFFSIHKSVLCWIFFFFLTSCMSKFASHKLINNSMGNVFDKINCMFHIFSIGIRLQGYRINIQAVIKSLCTVQSFPLLWTCRLMKLSQSLLHLLQNSVSRDLGNLVVNLMKM